MTTTSKYCLICYNKASCDIGSSKSDIGNAADGAQVTLKLFFKLLERLLNENVNSAGGNGKSIDGETMQFLFNQVIDAGMLACGDCFKILESFCQLYQEVKSLELHLNWKVGLLKDIMLSAEKDHSRMKMFREGAKLIKFEDISADEIIDLIVDLKGDLVKKCTRQLNRSLPRLTLDKVECSTEGELINGSHADSPVEPSEIKTENEGSDLNGANEDDGDDANDYFDRHVSPNDSLLAENDTGEEEEVGQTQHDQEKSKDVEGPISCNLCGMELKTRRGLKMHIGRVHPEAEPIKTICDEPTKNIRAPTPTQQPDDTAAVMCNLCGRKFSSVGNYYQHHQSVHVGVRFKCEKCGQLFTQRSGLKVHQRTSISCGGNAAKYNCPICDKAFTKSGGLNQHKKSVHLKAKDYLCSECGKGFPYLNELKRHQTVHSDLRRHLCDLCGKGFKFQGQLTAHKKTHVGIELVGAGEPNAHEPDAGESVAHETDAGEFEAHEPDAGESEDYELDAGESEAHEPVSVVSEAHDPDAHQPSSGKSEAHDPGAHEHRPNDSSSKLRSLHRCGKCSKTFSTSVKLAEHQRSHKNLEDGNEEDIDDNANEDSEGSESDYDCRIDEDSKTRTGNSQPDTRRDDNTDANINMDDDSPPSSSAVVNSDSEDDNQVKKSTTQARRRPGRPTGSVKIKSIINPETGKHGCTLCGQEYERRITYLHHFRRVHTHTTGNDERHKCRKCSNTFKHKAGLWVHQRFSKSCGTAKRDRPKSKCTICGKEFAYPNDLKSHIKHVHHKIRDHPCNLCGKRFFKSNHLKIHVNRIHSGLPKHSCKQCGEKFFSKLELKSHRLESHRKKETGHHRDQEAEEDQIALIISQLESSSRKVNEEGNKPGDGMPGPSQNKSKNEEISYAPPIKVFSSDLTEEDKKSKGSLNPETGRLQCLICSKTFSGTKPLKCHHETMHLQIRYKCSLCADDKNEVLFKFVSQYYAHCQKLHLNGTFKCEECGKAFGAKRSLTDHLRRVHSRNSRKAKPAGGTFNCPICEKKFKERVLFKIHYKTVHLKLHPGYRLTKCDLCGKEFTTVTGYRLHHKSVHLGVSFKCDKCNKRFAYKNGLRLHQETSFSCGGNVPKCECSTCGKCFQTTAKLKLHVKSVHEKAKDHLCSECGKGFPTVSELKRHQAVHSDLKGHLCDLCGKGFKWRTQLVSHRAKDHAAVANTSSS